MFFAKLFSQINGFSRQLILPLVLKLLNMAIKIGWFFYLFGVAY